ncbi:kynurenine formamidase [Jatrophihabitans sp. GAS493]|uniref:cyclase family protein n=1 Tax=Jatrophihabitans sp. GAS493 TaxID=1907575 RepID=UPI000BB6FDC5|nr:cyclase family protein [Jatrophihabitans sp. GAS493]SOD70357.1 kynurenine formamidase [Jatrophihabitans sp. GAS493]
MFFDEIVDLGHPLYTGMPCHAAEVTAFWTVDSFEKTRRLSGGRQGLQNKMMLLSEHTGTHFDAPSHFDEHGLSVDQVPLERLVLPGHLLDLTHKRPHEPIGPQDLAAAEEASGHPIVAGTAVFVRTGQDVNWGSENFFTERPHVTSDGAQWLVDKGIGLFCTDLIAIDNPQEWWEPTHTAFLCGGVPMVQQLNNLARLVGREFTFVVLPLPMKGGTASPVRPVALLHP